MITVFKAKKIITMNPSWPEGTAVAVKDGQILEVGTAETLKPWLGTDEVEINEDYIDSILMPGLIDPHLHPVMAAVLLPMQFITAMTWEFPWEQVKATITPEDYVNELRISHRKLPQGEDFFTWGYHRNWHGDMNRALLDEIFAERPAVVWQRSFHEVYLNSAMMAKLGLDEDQIKGRPQIDYERGHFYENGLGYAINRLNVIIMSSDWLDRGLRRLCQLVHFGGHTTLGDMALGIFNVEREWQAATEILDQDDTPFRVLIVPHAGRMLQKNPSDPDPLENVAGLQDRATNKLRFGRKIKLFTDGAFFSQLAMLLEPGYIDGHEGEWLAAPEQYEVEARRYWHAGYQIHVHCTGDLGLELALDTLAKLQQELPRYNHGYTIEHFGFSTPEQIVRMKALGARVSANVYYLFELSDMYSQHGVGVERSYQMARLGSCERAGIPVALHSDFPMAPASPLQNAWIAANRINAAGNAVAPDERVTLDTALRAITIEAAATLGLENETGSIRSGKKADFVILDRDPYEVGIAGLRDIKVLATVFEGEVFALND